MNQAKQPRKPRCWTLWLLLAASTPEFAAADAAGLLRRLELPPGDYWVASNGLAQPLSASDLDPDRFNEVLLLRRESGTLEPVGWFEIHEQTLAGSQTSATSALVDSSPPTASARLSGSWLETDSGRLMAAPQVRLVLSFEDPAGVQGWVLSDTHPVSIADGRWAPGLHQLSIQARDALGNAGQAAALTFDVDAEGPALSWSIESEALTGGVGEPVYQPPVMLRVSADDPAGLAGLEIDQGDGWQSMGDKVAMAVSASSVRLRATDRLGNPTVSDASWRYDLEPPVITVLAQGVEVAEEDEVALPVGGTISVMVTDDGVGVDSASYRYNRKALKPLPESIRFVDRGWYQVEIRASDRLGNERVRYVDVRTSPRSNRPKRAAEAMGDGS